jgi:hypothetical protein
MKGGEKEVGNEARNTLVGMRELMFLGCVGGGKEGTVALYAADLR